MPPDSFNPEHISDQKVPFLTHFQTRPLKSIHFQTWPLKSIHFQTRPLKSIHFQTQPLKSIHFQTRPLKSILFQTRPLKSIHFQTQHLKSIHFQTRPLKSIHFQTWPLKQSIFRPGLIGRNYVIIPKLLNMLSKFSYVCFFVIHLELKRQIHIHSCSSFKSVNLIQDQNGQRVYPF